MSAVPLVDLKKEKEVFGKDIQAAIEDVMARGEFIMGREVTELEEKLKEYCGAKHCIAVSSGTDALVLALMALGIGPGDEVITTPFSWVSSAEVVAFVGAKVVFADIDRKTYCLSPEAVRGVMTPKTKAVIPVSLFGHPADISGIADVVGGVPIIEDGAQSFGSKSELGFSGAISLIGTTSFFPTKPLGCYGDGGAVFTTDDAVAASVRSLRVHGKDARTKLFSQVGMNARLDTMQAAILLVKLRHLDDMLEQRVQVAIRYNELLGSLPGVILPACQQDCRHVYAVYTIRNVKHGEAEILVTHVKIRNLAYPHVHRFEGGEQIRSAVQSRLKEAGIANAVYYAKCIHEQPAYSSFASGPLPEAELAGSEVLSLPMHPYLTEKDQRLIASEIQLALA